MGDRRLTLLQGGLTDAAKRAGNTHSVEFRRICRLTADLALDAERIGIGADELAEALQLIAKRQATRV
jgi:hypothetical protein